MSTTLSDHDLKLFITRCPVPTATGLALDLGLLRDRLDPLGTRVEFWKDQEDKALPLAHFDHSNAALIREGGNIPAIWARSIGRDTRLLGITWLDEYQAVLALPEANIRSPGDLAGKRLGVLHAPGAAIDFHAAQGLRGILTALELGGLGFEDVTLVDLERPVARRGADAPDVPVYFAAEAGALRRGLVDAVYVKGAAGVETARALGAVEVAEFGHHPDPTRRINNGTPRTITVHADLLSHRRVIVELLVALLDAARIARDRRAEADQVLTRETRVSGHGISRAYPSLTLEPSLSSDRISALNNQQNFLYSQGFIPDLVNIQNWIEPELLQEAQLISSQG